MRDKTYRRFLFESAAGASGEGIFSNAEVMTPAEFVEKYGTDELKKDQKLAEGVSLFELIYEAGYQRRRPKPPQASLSPDNDIKGSELDPTKLADVLGTRAEKGKLPGDIPYIHPGTAKSTLVPPQSLVRKPEAGGDVPAPSPEEIVIVDEQHKPIDLNVLAQELTNYSKPTFTLLKQNEKMKKSSTGELEAYYNIGIPAIMGLVYDEKDAKFKIINTCPGAGSCMHVCYASKGGYVQYQHVSEKQNLTLNLLYNHPDQYIDKAVAEIVGVVKDHATPKKDTPRGIKTVIRWHDAGDFFSEDYMRLSLHITERVKSELPYFLRDHVSFYAYTKMAKMANKFADKGILLRKSIGAKPEEEREIHPDKDLFSQIVPASVKNDMTKQGVIAKIDGKWKYAPGREEEFKQAIKNSPEVKFKNNYPMLTMDEYEASEEHLNGEKVNVIILPGQNDRPAKDPNVAGVYLVIH